MPHCGHHAHNSQFEADACELARRRAEATQLQHQIDALREALHKATADNAKLKAALMAAEDADQQANNCTEHAPEMAPESCEKCFPKADEARLRRWDALGIKPEHDDVVHFSQ